MFPRGRHGLRPELGLKAPHRKRFRLKEQSQQLRVVHGAPTQRSRRWEAGRWDACAVAGRNGLRVTMHPARVLDLLLKPCLCLASQTKTPQLSKSHGQPEPLDTAGPRFCMVPSPQSSFEIFEPPSIQVRTPYQLIKASSGFRSVRITQADSYPASQCINNPPLTRLFFPAKHSTSPCQLVPGVVRATDPLKGGALPTRRALIPTLSRKNGCQPHARMPSHNQRAYNPRSANTITCHPGGTASWMELSSPSQCGRRGAFLFAW